MTESLQEQVDCMFVFVLRAMDMCWANRLPLVDSKRTRGHVAVPLKVHPQFEQQCVDMDEFLGVHAAIHTNDFLNPLCHFFRVSR